MTASDVIAMVAEAGGEDAVTEGGDVRLTATNPLPPVVVERVRDNKAAVVEYLRRDVLTQRRQPGSEPLGFSPSEWQAAELNRDRPRAARRLAELTGCTVLLKGAASVVADPEGRLVVNPTGGPALGTGGTGDVLLGMLAGLLAQGLEASPAAALSAFWHGLAADRIAERTGPSGLLAGDLGRILPEVARELRAAAAAGGSLAGAGFAVSFPEP